MKIPSSYLRQKLVTLLTGNVTYDDGEGFNDVVPVVSTEGVESKYQIFIGDYSDSDIPNTHIFRANATQVIEIICEDFVAKKKHVDAIGELVTDLILPTTLTETLNGTDFKIIVSRPSVNHIVENQGSDIKKIVRLLLRYSLNINHN